jgi:hypothetical protein
MIRRAINTLWAKIVFAILVAMMRSAPIIAQNDVEIEIAGPWSYVEDPADPSRIIVITPDVGHTMAVFMGDDPLLYVNVPHPTNPALGSHRLEFATVSCSSSPTPHVPVSHTLYPANGVTSQIIHSALTSSTNYSLSLPKPCSYLSALESHMKFNSTKPVADNDPENNFTTWMTLRYKVNPTTTGAVLDQGTPHATNVTFGSNSSSSKKGIGVIVYLNVPPDTDCDSHSATAFDATLKLWNLPSVYRAFPQLTDLGNSNQQHATYCYGCAQTPNGVPTQCTVRKRTKRAPGRADCHAPQLNVNGVVE